MRVLLGGRAIPREEFALTGSGVDTSGSVPITLLMEDGEVFNPEDYISLGYTNFEAWCVGAAGGRGGDQSNETGGWSQRRGGAGGGGGLHRVSGLLSDLPAEVPVVVGEAGSDGANDNGAEPRLVTSLGRKTYIGPQTTSIYVFFDPVNWRFEPGIVVVNPAWVPGQPGGDGGASSFGDICQASGGKGGLPPTPEFETGSFDWVIPTPGPQYSVGTSADFIRLEPAFSERVWKNGKGGDGGRGGQTIAGGGAAGGAYDSTKPNPYIKPKDGTWDGTVGKGGGGGLGGINHSFVSNDPLEGI